MRIAIAGLLWKLESVEIIGPISFLTSLFWGRFRLPAPVGCVSMTAVRLLENDDLAEVKNLKGGL